MASSSGLGELVFFLGVLFVLPLADIFSIATPEKMLQN
jgi:hypothetical protein